MIINYTVVKVNVKDAFFNVFIYKAMSKNSTGKLLRLEL